MSKHCINEEWMLLVMSSEEKEKKTKVRNSRDNDRYWSEKRVLLLSKVKKKVNTDWMTLKQLEQFRVRSTNRPTQTSQVK